MAKHTLKMLRNIRTSRYGQIVWPFLNIMYGKVNKRLQIVLSHLETFPDLSVYLIQHITRNWQMKSLENIFNENLFALHLWRHSGVSLSFKVSTCFFFIVVLGVISASSFISLSRQAVEQVQFDP